MSELLVRGYEFLTTEAIDAVVALVETPATGPVTGLPELIVAGQKPAPEEERNNDNITGEVIEISDDESDDDISEDEDDEDEDEGDELLDEDE